MVKHARLALKYVIVSVALLVQHYAYAQIVDHKINEAQTTSEAERNHAKEHHSIQSNNDLPAQDNETLITEQSANKLPSQQIPASSLNSNYSWLENIHSTVSGTVFYTARWFDNFFNDDDSEQLNPKTNLRIRLGWIPENHDVKTTTEKFRLRVKLPHFKNKLDLVLSDDDDSDSQSDEDLSAKPGVEQRNWSDFTAAIRYVHSQTLGGLLDSRLGVSSGDVFYRLRYKKRMQWQQKHSVKIEPALSYYMNDGWGSKTLIEYTAQLAPAKQFRVSSTLQTLESYKGIRWDQGFHHLIQYSDKSAALFGLNINGQHQGDDGSGVDAYTVSYRYRFNAVKTWLYFEIEPFVAWRKNASFQASPGIALRIEGHFSRK